MYHDLRKKWPGNIYHGKNVTLQQGNFMEMSLEPTFYDIIYVDPPWNQAILNKFYEYAGQQAPIFREWLTSFLGKCMEVCPQGLVMVEMGLPQTSLLQALGVDFLGAKLLQECRGTYGLDIPFSLSILTWGKHPLPLLQTFLGYEYEVCKGALRSLSTPGQSLLDPCTGTGGFVKVGLQLGLNCVGIELIPEKYALAVNSINKLAPMKGI